MLINPKYIQYAYIYYNSTIDVYYLNIVMKDDKQITAFEHKFEQTAQDQLTNIKKEMEK